MLADLADKMVEEYGNEKVGVYIKDIFMKNISKGSFYKIIHKKPSGENIVMFGKIKEVGEELKVYRRLRYGGELDGLGVRINDGDYAISTIKSNNSFIKHEYFTRDDKPIGKYFSINTPIEMFPKIARYLDLEVDVVEKDGIRKIIAIEKLNESNIPKKLKEMAMETAKMIEKGDIDG